MISDVNDESRRGFHIAPPCVLPYAWKNTPSNDLAITIPNILSVLLDACLVVVYLPRYEERDVIQGIEKGKKRSRREEARESERKTLHDFSEVIDLFARSKL